jgi:hypothetical protein
MSDAIAPVSAAVIVRAAIGLFALSAGLLFLAFRRAPDREGSDLDDGPPPAEPWRRPIDTGLGRTLRIAREGRH